MQSHIRRSSRRTCKIFRTVTRPIVCQTTPTTRETVKRQLFWTSHRLNCSSSESLKFASFELLNSSTLNFARTRKVARGSSMARAFASWAFASWAFASFTFARFSTGLAMKRSCVSGGHPSKFQQGFQLSFHQKMQTPSLFRHSLCKKSMISYHLIHVSAMFQQCSSNFSAIFWIFFIILTPYSTIHNPHPIFRPLLESSIEFAYFFHLIHEFSSFWPLTVPYMTPTQFFALYLNLLSNLHIFFILSMNFHHFDVIFHH